MNVSFVPKDNCIHTYGEPIVVVQRLNKIWVILKKKIK
jgi:hypothetical protein